MTCTSANLVKYLKKLYTYFLEGDKFMIQTEIICMWDSLELLENTLTKTETYYRQ